MAERIIIELEENIPVSFNVESPTITPAEQDPVAQQIIGELAQLYTSNKKNLVLAINSLFTQLTTLQGVKSTQLYDTNGLKKIEIWIGTLAEYQNLSNTSTSDTLYIITDEAENIGGMALNTIFIYSDGAVTPKVKNSANSDNSAKSVLADKAKKVYAYECGEENNVGTFIPDNIILIQNDAVTYGGDIHTNGSSNVLLTFRLDFYFTNNQGTHRFYGDVSTIIFSEGTFNYSFVFGNPEGAIYDSPYIGKLKLTIDFEYNGGVISARVNANNYSRYGIASGVLNTIGVQMNTIKAIDLIEV